MDEINKEELKDDRTMRRKWWIPLVFSLVFTPIAILLAALSHGLGH